VQTFTYDSKHRSLSATTNLPQGEETTVYFLYVGQNEIGSLDTNLQVQDFRVLGYAPHAEIDAAVGIELGGQIYALIHDLSGNITQLLPLDGTEPIETRYSAFGEETGSRLSPWRFSSKRVDEKTDLVYYGRRFYQREFGRWLSPDPAGFTDGMNLYAFVHNDPLTHFDKYELLDCEQWNKTPQQRLDEQRGIIWGASGWENQILDGKL
jgi:RHS repeat-associated protein